MDGKGRAVDNIFIERLWRSLKWEYVFLNPENDGLTLYKGLKDWFAFYNNQWNHASIENKTPKEM